MWGAALLVMAKVVGDLAFQGGLQEPLGQPLEQPTLAGQLQVLSLSTADQLVDELVVHLLRRLRLSGLDGLSLGTGAADVAPSRGWSRRMRCSGVALSQL